MRCLVAVDNLRSDVIFIDCDTQFSQFLQSKAKELYGEEYSGSENSAPDLHVASFYFQYLVTIQEKQTTNDNPLTSVLCRDGLVVAFHRFDNIDVIAIENDVSLKDVAMTRCVVFEKLAKLHFGPATLFLKPDDLLLRKLLWSKLQDYLNSWEEATGISPNYKSTDVDYISMMFEEKFKQNFLFQSVEELHVNAMLKTHSAQLMFDALSSAQKIERTYSQAILVVNGKVLFSHSTRHHEPLDPSDLIFVLFIAHCSLPQSPVINIDLEGDLSGGADAEHCYQQTIFLKTLDHTDHYLPCTLTAFSIRAGIVLILLAEASTSIAPNICRAINSLLHLQKLIEDVAEKENKTGSLETGALSTEFLKVKGVIDFYLTRMGRDMNKIPILEDPWNKIQNDWRNTVETSNQLGESNRSFHQFDRFIGDLVSSLRHLFYAIYCTNTDNEIHNKIQDIYHEVKVGLRDSASYLLVKAQRNFTLANYLSDFPGIVHFLFINRSQNKIIVPCLSGEKESAVYCHKIIQTLYRFHKRMLYAGYSAGYMRKHDLVYGYRLWFANSELKITIKPDKQIQFVPVEPHNRLLCVVYKEMMAHYFPGRSSAQVECFELLTIHVGDLPLEYISDLNRRLVDNVSGEFS